MTELMLVELCHIYALGKPLASPTRVFGGLLHRMYRLPTTQGEFAVKVLNPTIMQYADVRAKFRLSERISSAVATAGLPAVFALIGAGDVVHDIGPVTVMVFPWINAQALTTFSAPPEQARQIGSILGRIHALPLRFDELTLPEWPSPTDFQEAEWALLVDDAERKSITWAQEVRSLLPEIAAWIRLSHEAQQALGNTWVVSHGDLDQKNVLWSDSQTPWLIDWESAGFVQPAMEAVGAALDWCGQAAGQFHAIAFEAFLEGYREARKLTTQEVECGLQAYCGNWCGWLKFNIQRSLRLEECDPEGQALGTRETFSTLAMLRSASVQIPSLLTPS